MKYTRALVTGATGFLGSYLSRLLLQKGYHVRGLRRAGSSLDLVSEVAEQIEWVEADITDVVALEEAMKGVQCVFHCAAISSFLPQDARRMQQINVEGTGNVVNLCLHLGIEKLVYVSSIAALGRSPERLHLDETCHWVESRDNTRYARTKHLAEQEVWRGIAEGLQAVIVSPSVITGSQDWQQGMAGFFKKIDEGLKFCPTGQSGFVDVRDVALFMEQAMQDDRINGERFILNAVNIPHREFFGLIADALQAPRPRIMVGPFLAEVAWRVEWLKHALLGATPMATKESARGSVTHYYYSNQKSLTLPGFQYRPFESSILETARQYQIARQHHFKPMVLPF